GNPRCASDFQVASHPQQGPRRYPTTSAATGNPEDAPMSGAMRKIGEYLGLVEDTGSYDDEYDERGYAEAEAPQGVRRTPVPAAAPSASVADISQRRRTQASGPAPSVVSELSRIT